VRVAAAAVCSVTSGIQNGTKVSLSTQNPLLFIIQRSRLTMAKENNAPVVVDEEEAPPDMSLKDITDGDNGRGIPAALFVEDITSFAESFKPHAKAELLIGAYTQLHTKYKSSEASLKNKRKLRSLAGY
jgi:hypothetical protein